MLVEPQTKSSLIPLSLNLSRAKFLIDYEDLLERLRMGPDLKKLSWMSAMYELPEYEFDVV